MRQYKQTYLLPSNPTTRITTTAPSLLSTKGPVFSMPPRSSNRSKKVSNSLDEQLESFTTTSSDAMSIRDVIMKTPYKFLPDISYLNKAASVTDKLRKAYKSLTLYDRNSMKGGIRRILMEDQIRLRVETYFREAQVEGGQLGTNNHNVSIEDEDDNHQVSGNKQPISFLNHLNHSANN